MTGPDDTYPRLATLVAGRRVDVLCRKDKPTPQVHDVVVRFNHDEAPADIWATAFFGTPSATLAASAQLVIGTVPETTEEISPHGWTKNFAAEKALYLATGEISLDRIEQIEVGHWRALRDDVPALPLTGIVFLSMLKRTRFDRCVIHGMDFYSDAATPLRWGRWHGDVHDLHLAAIWVQRLLDSDPRFEFIGDIQQCIAATSARIALSSAAYAATLESDPCRVKHPS
jgi:hypothetical protein